MSIAASVVSLKVQPARSSEHSFNIAGIVDTINPAIAKLGAMVTAYDVRADLYTKLGQPEVDGAGTPTGRLTYDSAKIRQTLLPVAAAVLSNEAMAVDLDQAILRRQTQFLSRNQFVTQLQALIQAKYPGKVTKLTQLLALTERHFQELDAAYNPPGGNAAGVTSPKVVMATRVSAIGSTQESTTQISDTGGVKQTHTALGASYITKYNPTANAWQIIHDTNASTLSQETVSVSENDELRHPNLENQIRHQRTTADLLDEILTESTFNLTVPNLPRIWANELAIIDLDVRRLQIQFIETFLCPRLSGMVTAVLKEAGDNVRAGEGVIRIEGDAQIRLAGQVKCRDQLTIGQLCVVETKNVFASKPAVELRLDAKVAAIRGYDSESGQWSLVLEAQNGNPRLPLGYDFEPHPDCSKITFA